MASGDGGGIATHGTLSLINTTVSINTASVNGGGIRNFSGTLAVTNSTINGNISTNSSGAGGGIYSSGHLTINNTSISSNRAEFGGGVYNLGTASLAKSSVSDNHSFSGAGIRNILGSLTTDESSVHSNVSEERGAGIYNDTALTIINSTVSGNDGGVEGAGIRNLNGTLLLINTTIAQNTATVRGGGLANHEGTVILLNTIMGGNATNGDCFGTIVSQGHNLIEDPTGCDVVTGPTDLANTDPLLGPLQCNGGPTLTHALLPGSPTIDAGDDAAAPDTDQHGVPRPQGVRSDIGAYERGPDCAGRASTIVGTNAADFIVGTPGDDVIVARGGGDIVRALAGNDVVCAGGGNDKVLGGKGHDWLLGGAGLDLLKGQRGNDKLFGQGGGDRLIGSGGKDGLNGGGGNDQLSGNRGDDRLLGRAGDDALNCGPGNDVGRGGPGTDAAFRCETTSGLEPETLGRVTIMDSDNDDFSDMLSDMAVVQLKLPSPGPDEIYEGWLVSDDGSRKQSTGILVQDGNGAVNQTYTSPVGENLFAEFGTFVVTVEPVPDPDPGPSAEVVALHEILSGGLLHIRHLAYSWTGNPLCSSGFHTGTPKGSVDNAGQRPHPRLPRGEHYRGLSRAQLRPDLRRPRRRLRRTQLCRRCGGPRRIGGRWRPRRPGHS